MDTLGVKFTLKFLIVYASKKQNFIREKSRQSVLVFTFIEHIEIGFILSKSTKNPDVILPRCTLAQPPVAFQGWTKMPKNVA